MGGSDDRASDCSGRGPGFESGIPPGGGYLTLREAMPKPLWQMCESVVQNLVEVEEVCSGSAAQKLQWKQEEGHMKLEELISDEMTSAKSDGCMWRWWWQKGREHLDPKKQPPGTEILGSLESTEEFPDRMKMDERTQIRKIHKKFFFIKIFV